MEIQHNNNDFTEVQSIIFSILAKKIKKSALFTTMRYFIKTVSKADESLSRDIVEQNIEVVLDEFVKLGILKKHTAIFIDLDTDIILEPETMDHYYETGKLYHPDTGLEIPFLDGENSYGFFNIYES